MAACTENLSLRIVTQPQLRWSYALIQTVISKSDQLVISLYNDDTLSSRQVRRMSNACINFCFNLEVCNTF